MEIVINALISPTTRRDQWPMFSTYSCWQLLVNQTKSLSKDHATLSEIYTTHLVSRLQTVIEDVQRIYKKCREIGYETHEEILRVLHELHTTMKTYHSYQVRTRSIDRCFQFSWRNDRPTIYSHFRFIFLFLRRPNARRPRPNYEQLKRNAWSYSRQFRRRNWTVAKSIDWSKKKCSRLVLQCTCAIRGPPSIHHCMSFCFSFLFRCAA